MRALRAALVQMTVQEKTEDSLARAEGFLRKAKEQGAQLALLPEMFCCPYQTKNFPLYAQREGGEVWQALSGMAKKYDLLLAAGSVPEVDGENRVYNTAYVFDREGRQIAKHRKLHLFDVEVEGGISFRESDTLTPGNSATTFDTPWGKMGLCVCFDFRFPELVRLMADQGAQVILVPAAFNMTTGPAHWEILFRTRAMDNQLFTLGAAPARDPSSSYTSYGNSIAVSPWGTVLARLDEKENLLLTDLDLDLVEKIRKEMPLHHGRRHDIYPSPPQAPRPQAKATPTWPAGH